MTRCSGLHDGQDWTPAEQRVIAAAATGATTDFREASDVVSGGSVWGPERSLRAEAVVALVTGELADAGPPRAVSVAGARITGRLDLEALSARRPLVLRECYFEQPVVLDEARAARLDFSGSEVPALRARQLETRGDLTLDRVSGVTGVVLAGARIGGVLSLRAARLSGTLGVALDADRLEVHVEMDCSGLQVAGEIRMIGAHIRGELILRGAHISNAGGEALSADGLRVDQGMFGGAEPGRRLEVDGELRLAGARIGGQLDLNGARLTNGFGSALTAHGLEVDREMLCSTYEGRRFEVDGGLQLVGAHIGGPLELSGARLTNAGAPALVAERLRIDHGLFCKTDSWGWHFTADGPLDLRAARIGGHLDLSGARFEEPSPVGLIFGRGHANRLSLPESLFVAVDLSYAVVSHFHDSPDGVPSRSRRYRASVTEFSYDSLGPAGQDCGQRLAWLARASDGYVPQAYDQLASVYRRSGRDDDAKKVMIAKHIRQREAFPLIGQATSFVIGVSVGYGYRTWRAAAALVLIVFVGWLAFSAAHPNHMSATRPEAELPDFSGLLYSLDAVLPVVNLGQEVAWSPVGAAQAWYGFSVLAGWLFGLGLVALVTARFFRE